jgi:hypothetical protein
MNVVKGNSMHPYSQNIKINIIDKDSVNFVFLSSQAVL